MGLLVEGKWVDQWYDTTKSGGRFVRTTSQFRNWVTPDGDAGFKAEPNRYHLYVSLACPWAHRTLIFRKLKKLEPLIDVTIVHPHMLKNGWELLDEQGKSTDPLYGLDFLYQLYSKAQPNYSGRVTVPVLWDKKNETIVNNESAEIIRMFNSSFNDHTDVELDFYPQTLRPEIDAINETVYQNINNGVYRCGFATTQQAYDEAFETLFSSLDELEERLGKQRYLVGNRLTEADWRLFTTLIRFDAVYVGHFKCNLRRIADYTNLDNYLRELYQYPGVAETVNMTHIKQHYYYSHHTINPHRLVPQGPALQFTAPHNRDRFETTR